MPEPSSPAARGPEIPPGTAEIVNRFRSAWEKGECPGVAWIMTLLFALALAGVFDSIPTWLRGGILPRAQQASLSR